MGKQSIKPMISFSGRKKRMYISRDVLRILEYPSHVCIYMSKDYDFLAIGPCKSENVMSFKVPEKIYEGKKADFTINSQQFVFDVMRINQMDMENTYRIYGQYLEEDHAVTFHLGDATLVSTAIKSNDISTFQ